MCQSFGNLYHPLFRQFILAAILQNYNGRHLVIPWLNIPPGVMMIAMNCVNSPIEERNQSMSTLMTQQLLSHCGLVVNYTLIDYPPIEWATNTRRIDIRSYRRVHILQKGVIWTFPGTPQISTLLKEDQPASIQHHCSRCLGVTILTPRHLYAWWKHPGEKHLQIHEYPINVWESESKEEKKSVFVLFQGLYDFLPFVINFFGKNIVELMG